MDYKKIYDNLMVDRMSKKIERLSLKKNGDYFEGHHIIPKSKGGDGNSNRPKNNKNIVLLTAREHFLSHWLLWRIYQDKSTAMAFHKMLSCNKNQKRIICSRGYEEARIAFRTYNLGNQNSKGKTRIVSEEQKKKHSQIMKGRMIGDLNPSKRDDVRKKISDKLKGVKKSETHREKLSFTLKNKEKIICPFCSIQTNKLNALKWHFNHCKLNPNMTNRPTTNFKKNNTFGCKKIIIKETNIIFNSIKDTSSYFNVTPSTVSRWLKTGKKIDYYIY
jgi:hypothetical protein